MKQPTNPFGIVDILLMLSIDCKILFTYIEVLKPLSIVSVSTAGDTDLH